MGNLPELGFSCVLVCFSSLCLPSVFNSEALCFCLLFLPVSHCLVFFIYSKLLLYNQEMAPLNVAVH